jgi:hypothetical protein
MAEPNDKKLHVDADWKEQVKAERERLAHEESSRPAMKGPAGPVAAPGAAELLGEQAPGAGEDESLPPASFATLVQTLATQAMLFLTPQRDPQTQQAVINVDLAKHSIDLLSVLEEKTKGNLTDDEKRLLDTALYQTRMAYVRVAGI